jgi:hypothetical protein
MRDAYAVRLSVVRVKLGRATFFSSVSALVRAWGLVSSRKPYLLSAIWANLPLAFIVATSAHSIFQVVGSTTSAMESGSRRVCSKLSVYKIARDLSQNVRKMYSGTL